MAFFALLDRDEHYDLGVRFEIFRLGSILKENASPRRVVKGVFDQISCFQNFPFQVVTSVRRLCFLRSDMNVLLPPKAEILLRTDHDCPRYSKEAVRL